MKRKNNLYENMCSIKNIEEAFNEVCKNTKNKRKVELFKEYKCTYISRIYKILKNREYKTGIYNFNSLIASVNSFYSLDKNFTEMCLKKVHIS